MKSVSWISLPAILITLIFIFVPAVLWFTDRLFRKALGGRIFVVKWHPKWMAAAVLLWILDRIWVYWND